MTAPDWQTHLQPGEDLLWQGVPVPGRRWSARQVVNALLGAVFALLGVGMFLTGILAVFFAESLTGVAGLLFLAAIGVFISLVGGFLVIEPFRDPVTQARHNRYALSNKAAFVARLKPVQRLMVLPILPGTMVELEKGGRTDTVRMFNNPPATPPANPPADLNDYPANLRLEFDAIANGDAVFRMIRGLQEGMPR